MHFIGSYERTDQESQLVVTSALLPGAFPATFNRHQGFVKVTNRLSNNHTLTAPLQLQRAEDHRRVRRTDAARTADRSRNGDTWEVQGTITSVLSPRRVNELRFQVSKFVNESTNLTDEPRSVYTGFATFGANTGNPQDIVENRLQFVDKLSRDFGAHRPSVGSRRLAHLEDGRVQRQRRRHLYLQRRRRLSVQPKQPRQLSGQFKQGFTDPRRPITLHRDFRSVRFRRHRPAVLDLSFFAQDDWLVREG